MRINITTEIANTNQNLVKDNPQKNLIRLILLNSFVYTFYLKFYQFFNVGTYPVTVFDLNFLLLIMYITYESIWLGKSLYIPKSPILSSLLLIIVVFLSSIIYPLFNGSSIFLFQFLKTYLHFVYLTLLGFLFAIIRVNTFEITTIIKSFIYTSIPIHIFGIYQLFARAFDLPLAFIEYNNILFTLEDQYGVADGVSQLSLRFENFYRATSIFSEPSALGIYSSLILSFLLVPYFNKIKLFVDNKPLFFIALVLALSNLLLAFSNSGLFNFVLILLLLIFVDKKIKFRSLIYTLLLFSVFFIIVDSIVEIYTNISVLGLFYDRLEGIFYYISGNRSKMMVGESFDTRADNFGWMIDIWTRYPFTGIGMGLVKLNGIYPVRFSEFFVAGALAETGLQGVMAFTLFFVILWNRSIFITKNFLQNKLIHNDNKNIYAIVIYIILSITLINWVSANQFVSDTNWLFMGIAFAIISNFYYINNYPFIEFQIVKTPLKTKFSKNIIKYIQK